MIHCGVDHEKFWDLSWYEVQLYMMRWGERQRLEMIKIEEARNQTAILWSTIVNMSGKVSKKNVKPDDLYKKGKKKKIKLLSPEEVDQIFKENKRGK